MRGISGASRPNLSSAANSTSGVPAEPTTTFSTTTPSRSGSSQTLTRSLLPPLPVHLIFLPGVVHASSCSLSVFSRHYSVGHSGSLFLPISQYVSSTSRVLEPFFFVHCISHHVYVFDVLVTGGALAYLLVLRGCVSVSPGVI